MLGVAPGATETAVRMIVRSCRVTSKLQGREAITVEGLYQRACKRPPGARAKAARRAGARRAATIMPTTQASPPASANVHASRASWSRSGPGRVRMTPKREPSPKQTAQPCALRDGRDWARTSDPQLVELGAHRSTVRYRGTLGQDPGQAYGHRVGIGSRETEKSKPDPSQGGRDHPTLSMILRSSSRR